MRKVDADVEAQICSIPTQTPQEHGFPRPTWTLELLARVIAEILDVELSVGHLWKILRRLAAQSRSREVVVFVDEVDLHLNPKIGPDWMLPGRSA